MVDDDDVNNIQNDDKSKKRLTMADASKAAAVVPVKCERCGQYYYKDQGHVCR